MKRKGSRRYTEKEVRDACTADELFNMVETAVDPDVIQVFIHLFNICNSFVVVNDYQHILYDAQLYRQLATVREL